MGRSSVVETPWGDDIVIHAMPTGSKPVKMDLAVSIDGKTVFRDASGKLYSGAIRKGGLCYPVAEWEFAPGLMAGLVALGAITKKQAEEYKTGAAKRTKQRDARCDLDTFDRITTAHGIRVSPRERAKLVKAAGIDIRESLL